MSATAYLSTQTVTALRAMARDLKITGTSRLRKAELVNAIAEALDVAHGEAIDYAADVTRHCANGDIKHGNFWDCCNANPSKIVVFDEGIRQAVCKSCASRFFGEVQELQPGKLVACGDGCGKTYWREDDDGSEESVHDDYDDCAKYGTSHYVNCGGTNVSVASLSVGDIFTERHGGGLWRVDERMRMPDDDDEIHLVLSEVE